MSNTDFQDRLNRIAASTQQQAPVRDAPQARRGKMRRLNHGLLFAGALIMTIGIHGLTSVNRNYEAVRDTIGIVASAGLGLASFAAVLIGGFVLFRAAYTGQTSAEVAAFAQPARAARQPSTGTRVFFSLLGFAFGSIAVFYMFAAAVAHRFDTEAARVFTGGGVLMALFLVVVSLAFGFLGLFLRGYALGRVPVYFFVGGAVSIIAVRVLGINFLDWPEFVARLQ